MARSFTPRGWRHEQPGSAQVRFQSPFTWLEHFEASRLAPFHYHQHAVRYYHFKRHGGFKCAAADSDWAWFSPRKAADFFRALLRLKLAALQSRGRRKLMCVVNLSNFLTTKGSQASILKTESNQEVETQSLSVIKSAAKHTNTITRCAHLKQTQTQKTSSISTACEQTGPAPKSCLTLSNFKIQ